MVRYLLIVYWCKGIFGILQGIELSSRLPQREEINSDNTQILNDILIIYKYFIISTCDGLIFPSKREKQLGSFLKQANILFWKNVW